MMRLTFEIIDNKLVCPYQDEVEQVALEILETCDNIYFDVIPLTDKYDIIWCDKYKGWLLRYLSKS